jgi:hypothetical protein
MADIMAALHGDKTDFMAALRGDRTKRRSTSGASTSGATDADQRYALGGPTFYELLDGKAAEPEHSFRTRLRDTGLLPDGTGQRAAAHAASSPPEPTDLNQRRVWGAIDSACSRWERLTTGRYTAAHSGGYWLFRNAIWAGVDLQEVTDRLTQTFEANGYAAKPGANLARALERARESAIAHGPEPLEDRPMHPRADRPAASIGPDEGVADAESDSDAASKFAPMLLSRTALKELPDPEPLIDNTLDRGTVALLYGKWGTFKSFIAIDLAASVATGRAWQGRTTEKGRVLYVAAEGAFGMKARLDAWETGWRTTIADGEFDVLPRRVNLTSPADVREMAALVRLNGYEFIVFDTLARCMVGADENSAKDCGVVVDNLTYLRECTPNGRGVVLAVHHTGKDGKTFRGSSVFEAGVDTVYAVDADCGIINLDREKRKDGPEADSHELRFEQIEGTGSGVIGVHRGRGQASRVDRLLSVFDQNFTATGASKVDLRTVADMAPSTFHRAVNTLLQSGDLVNTGTDKAPFYKRGENVKNGL